MARTTAAVVEKATPEIPTWLQPELPLSTRGVCVLVRVCVCACVHVCEQVKSVIVYLLSGLMDCYTLTSASQPPLSHRYVAGVLKSGELLGARQTASMIVFLCGR